MHVNGDVKKDMMVQDQAPSEPMLSFFLWDSKKTTYISNKVPNRPVEISFLLIFGLQVMMQGKSQKMNIQVCNLII